MEHKCTQIDNITTLKVEFSELKTDINYIKEKIDAIHEQTLKTNGRVNKLDSWKDKSMGAMIIINVILLPLAFLVIQQTLTDTTKERLTKLETLLTNAEIQIIDN